MKRANPFYYSAEWRGVRWEALQRDDYRCVVCGADVSGSGQARVDHIKPLSTHPELGLCLDNLRTLCPEHDNQAHREKGRRGSGHGGRQERFEIRGCDASGRPLDPNHPWNRAAE